MKTDLRILILGAILSMVASYLVIVPKDIALGNVFFAVSNFLLYWYAVAAVWEYCGNLLNPPVNPPTQ